ncbi:hypothetical protein J2S76_001231 [Ancylobacter vacuolatus]|uniref:Uncharacterized protein n=2 Tax=Ancylobacter vacuolatus TaxID=223389 RepID=A0ABU0DEG8_9HYPH|nr:hypothetical protein [Ancylobacter vacuolatus]MDQ0346814.1 hypothetical protein [Ancylobacter vacuolatus]
MMERAELTSSMAEDAQAAGMNEPLATARQPRKAPECRSLALGDLTRFGPAGLADRVTLVS